MNYSIKDLDEFAKIMRHEAAISLVQDKQYDQDLDEFITIDQIKNIVNANNAGKDNDGLFLMNAETIETILVEIKNIIYQTSLSRLASAGYIECAWDDQKNNMTFWMNSKSGQLDILPLPDYY